MHQVTIAIACDHAGLELKRYLQDRLIEMERPVLDLGVNRPDPVDYPEVGFALAQALKDGRAGWGVLVCGSGIGMSIAANRFANVRAALIADPASARLARQHNDANVICFGGRLISGDLAHDCLKLFLDTPFEGGRHSRRVERLNNPY
jgi:ribose 5-phosphate isomerase B